MGEVSTKGRRASSRHVPDERRRSRNCPGADRQRVSGKPVPDNMAGLVEHLLEMEHETKVTLLTSPTSRRATRFTVCSA